MELRSGTKGRRIAGRPEGLYGRALTRWKAPEQRNSKFPMLQAELQGLAEAVHSHIGNERGAPVLAGSH